MQVGCVFIALKEEIPDFRDTLILSVMCEALLGPPQFHEFTTSSTPTVLCFSPTSTT